MTGPSGPPAEAQQDDERAAALSAWCRERGSRPHRDAREAFSAGWDAALAARPSADTETLQRVLMDHQTTRGMRVSMGWTCACGWWSRDQSPAAITAHQAEQLRAALDGDR